MADNNKNPRRTIWLSETEPLSHYDIWLSKNQHLNSDGEPVVDSGVQRDCDYIFKVWDCDNWHPIVGLNSTALNKINTVKNQGYNSTNPNTGHTINSYSYDEFHLPLFTKPASSPSELFDAGTIGDAILEYVTEAEWENIFEGDAFNNSFKLYFKFIVENGDININELLEPAKVDELGGIWADEFQIEDMFPDTDDGRYTDQEIENSYNWLAQAKYKLDYDSEGQEDYNLYVNAKDIISAINAYTTSNPSTSALSIPWATTETCGGILADVHRDSPNEAREAGVWVRFVPQNTRLYDISYGLPIPEHHLAITGEQLIKAINEEYSNHPDTPGITIDINDLTEALENIFKNTQSIGWSIITEHNNPSVYPNVWGANASQNAGKFLRIKKPYPELESGTNWDQSHNAIDWFSIVGGQGISVVEDQNMGQITISTTNQGTNTWRPIQINNTPITETNTLNIVAGQNITITPTIDGDVTTATISASSMPSPITISEGDGIDIEHTGSDYKVGINTQDASQGQVLSYDETNETVEWVTLQSGTSYTAGTGVQIDQNVIKSEVLVDQTQHTAQQSIKFECGENYIRTTLDLNNTFPLYPFNYTFIECGNNSDIIVNFTINTQKDCMKGDPVFVELDLSKANSTTVSFGNNMKYIDIGTSITGNSFKDRHVLITMQFGIVKIEGITTISI